MPIKGVATMGPKIVPMAPRRSSGPPEACRCKAIRGQAGPGADGGQRREEHGDELVDAGILWSPEDVADQR
jgi:hypothetical protein